MGHIADRVARFIKAYRLPLRRKWQKSKDHRRDSNNKTTDFSLSLARNWDPPSSVVRSYIRESGAISHIFSFFARKTQIPSAFKIDDLLIIHGLSFESMV